MDSTPEKPILPAETPATPVSTSASAPLPVLAASGEGLAENYIARELREARKSLKITQIGTLVGLTALTLYLGIITARLVNYAQPANAAEVANGIIGEQVSQHADSIAGQFKTQLPTLIAGLPDQAIQQMPTWRENLVSQIENDLQTHAKTSSDELSSHLDTFLSSNKEQIKTVLEVGADRQSVKQIGPDLERELMSYLEAPPEGGGDSIKTKVNQSLAMLTAMRNKTAHLANTPSARLSPEERKTKRAIALIARTVNRELKGFDLHKAVAEHLNPAIDSAAGHVPGTS